MPRGQLDSVERRINADATCAAIVQQATACRGALDGFIAEIIEDHIPEHMVDPDARRDDPRAQAAEELVEIVHSICSNMHMPAKSGGLAVAWNLTRAPPVF